MQTRARGKDYIEDLNEAGGISAVIKQLIDAGLFEGDALTASGVTQAERVKNAEVLDKNIIRPMDTPYSAKGGLAILKGNLAREGAVVKKSAVDKKMLRHSGPARVFDSEEAAMEAISTGKIVKGDVVVIRYESPMGRPRNARNALPHFRHRRRGTGRGRRAHHRRALFRRDARRGDRARVPRGGGGRRHRRRRRG